MKTMSEVIEETEKPRIQTARQFKASYESKPDSVCKSDCPICGGIGLVGRDLHFGDPEFGRLFPCPNADLFSVYGKRTGILESERAFDWENIVKNENVMEGLHAVAEALDRGFGWVFLWGGVGLAKTLILKIAVAHSLRNRIQASYARMAEVIDDLRGSFDADRPSREGDYRMRWWTESPVLCLDEFDRLRQTEYAEERRFVIMDNRYESALDKKTVTIMASNTNPATYDPYLFDRIRDGRFKIVKLTGESVRPMMRLDQ